MKKTLLIGLAICFAACSGSKPKPEEEPGSMHSPPSDDKVAMPKGAPMIDDEEATNASPAAEAPPSEPVEGEAFVTRSQLDAFADRGTAYVLTLVTVEPVREGDSLKGWQIVDVTRGAREFMMPQLRVGDVVTHINGIEIRLPDDLQKAWRTLEGAQAVRVDFTRQNAPMNAVWVVR